MEITVKDKDRYGRIVALVEQDGQLINRELDEYLGGIQGEFDADTRFAITWFEQNGLKAGDYGTANNIATARGISVESADRRMSRASSSIDRPCIAARRRRRFLIASSMFRIVMTAILASISQ